MTGFCEAIDALSRPGKNLLYLTSGNKFRDAYQSLGYDRVVLVDNLMRPQQVADRIFGVRMDCAVFLAKCLEENVGFDAVAIVNEGLWEGGGSYPLHNDWLLGYLIPLLKEEYIHIACPSYYKGTEYRRIYNKFLDIPFSRTNLSDGDPGYVNPAAFAGRPAEAKQTQVYRMTRERRKHQFSLGEARCSVQWDSVWTHRNDYDLIIVPGGFGANLFPERPLPSTKARVETLWSIRRHIGAEFTSFGGFLEMLDPDVKRIAFLPWAHGVYDAAVESIRNHVRSEICLDFYHLNKDDFELFYRLP